MAFRLLPGVISDFTVILTAVAALSYVEPASAQGSLPVFGSYDEARTADTITAPVVFIAGRALAGDGGEGWFRRDESDRESPDDGGAVLLASGGVRLKRVLQEPGSYSAEWFEQRPSRLSRVSSPSVQGSEESPDFYQLTNAIRSAGRFGRIHLAPREYTLDSMIYVLPGQKIFGHGAVLTRPDDVLATLTAPANVGARSITVDSSEGFGVGHLAVLIRGQTSWDTSWLLKVVETSGNTLTFQRDVGNDWGEAIASEWPAGTKLLRINTLLRTVPGDEVGIELHDIVFDGNSEGVKANLSWRINFTLILEGRNTVVANCTFRDIPSENITGWGGVIRDNHAFNLNGSFYHFSIVVAGHEHEEAKNGVLIDHNIVDGATQVPFNINGHNRGAVTFSRKSRRFWIVNNRFENIDQCAVGVLSPRNRNENMTHDLFITGNHFRNAGCGVGALRPPSEDDTWRRIVVTSNIFENVGAAFEFPDSEIDVRDAPFLSDSVVWEANIWR